MRFLIKITIAAAIFGVIASRVDLTAVLAAIKSANFALVGASIIASLAIILADAAFWSTSMRIVGFRMGFRPALIFSLVGWFFANIAPSTVGADLFRAAQMRFAGTDAKTSVRIVVAARLMSLASLLVVIGAGLPIAYLAIPDAAARWTLIAVFVVATAGFGLFVALVPALDRRRAGFMARLGALSPLARDTRTLLLQLRPGGWFYLTMQHLLRVAGVYLILRSLGVTADGPALFALVPAALLIAMVPVSFGGWGVREASFVHFLGYAGVEPAAALAASIVYGLTRVLIGAAGGIVWLAASRNHYAFAIDDGKAG